MRTRTARDIGLDEASWQLPRVDPTGWLVRPAPAGSAPPASIPRPDPGPACGGAGAGPDVECGPGPTGSPGGAGLVRRRRPRRSPAARAARERTLARRRRRSPVRVTVHRGAFDRLGERSIRIAPGVVSGRRVLPGPVRAAPAVDEPGYRIGRWGRLALTILTALALVLAVARAAGSAAPELVDVTVRPGDTLWSIATTASPERDPRAVIDQMRELNDISGDLVRVGEVLRVPTGSP